MRSKKLLTGIIIGSALIGGTTIGAGVLIAEYNPAEEQYVNVYGAKPVSIEKDEIDCDVENSIMFYNEHCETEHLKSLAIPNKILISQSEEWDYLSLKYEGFIDLTRKHNGKYYTVTKLNDGKYLFLLFEETLDKDLYCPYVLADGCIVSKLVDKDVFADIKVGMKKADIIEKDPSAYVSDEYSYHRLSDKSILQVNYAKDGENFIVEDYMYLTDSVNVINYLNDSDLALITDK